MDEITTTDLSRFGHRERILAEELLKAWREQGLPEDFYDDDVVIMFNTHSGNVFLTNSDFQAAMMNGEKLESFYVCPICGHEGFAEDMNHEGDEDCQEYLQEIGILEKPEEE